jgi:hypothetical protein
MQAGREKKAWRRTAGLPGVDNGSFAAANGVLYVAGRTHLYAFAECEVSSAEIRP